MTGFQDKKGENPKGAAKRDDRQMRLPPSERKRLAEHMNANEQHRKDLKAEMRQTERRRKAEERIDEYDDDDANPQGTAYSPIEMLRKKDFESFTWEEVHEVKRLLSEMHYDLGMRPPHRKA